VSEAKDDIDLMQHADGELDARSVASVEKRLASDPDARTKAEALGEVSELVRGHVELAVDDIPDARFDRMWRAIDDATSAPAGRAERARPEAIAESRAGERGTGFWAAFAGWFERYRGHVITGAVSAGAVATLALVLRSRGTEDAHKPRGNAIDVQPAALRVAPEIETLDTPDGEGTVLNLEDEDGHTTVIWISTADTVEGI
jgi:anti-sigma factor RsiW